MTATKRSLGLLLVFLVIGSWLRVWHIGGNSLWFDEVFSRNVAVLSDIPTIARDGVAGDVHPPLYFMLLNAWVHVTGDSAVALRMLSALTMMLAIPAFYHLGRLLFNPRTGTIALILGALAPFQIYYAQETRQYALSVMLGAWATVGLIALLRGKRYGWALYVVAGVGGLYTHYFVGLLLTAIHLWLLLYAPARRQGRRWLTADLAIALLFVPQLFQFARQSQAVLGGFWIDKPNPAAPITTLTFLLFSTTLPGRLFEVIGITITIAALVIAGVDVLRKAPRRIRPYWLLCLDAILLPLLVVLIISLGRSSIYLDKSFAMLSPFLLVSLAAGVAYARPPSVMPVLAALLIALMVVGTVVYGLTPDVRKPPFQTVAADLLARPDALAVPILYLHDSAYLPLSYYAPSLNSLAHVIDLGSRSWLFPATWRIFGVERTSRADTERWLGAYHGKLRVIVTANIEPPEVTTFKALLNGPCQHSAIEYPPTLAVYDFDCP